MFMDMLSRLLDDTPWTANFDRSFADEAFSDLLPYRVHDPETNFYYNEGSVGFLIETAPSVGQIDFGTLQSTINQYCPEQGTVQFINWTSPDLSVPLSKWSNVRAQNSDMVRRMTSARCEKLQQMSLGGEGLIKCVPHVRRIFVAGWIDATPSASSNKGLDEFRRNLIVAFGGDRMSRNLPPSELLDFIKEVTFASGDQFGHASEYDRDIAINHQVPGAGLHVSREGCTFLNTPKMSVSTASVSKVPKQFSFQMGALFNGSPERPEESPHGPVLISLVARAQSGSATASEMLKRQASIAHQSETKLGKYIPNLDEKKQEIGDLSLQVEQGERLFESLMTVSAFSRGSIDDSRAALTTMSSIFRSIGFGLQGDTFLQLPMFLSGMPFGPHKAVLSDMSKMSRVRRRKGAAVTAMAPVHGEWTGSPSPSGTFLIGRQGQAFYWDNFENPANGNFNVTVTGKSGSGKSVFMQELVASVFMAGGKVLIIDDGGSFKNTCEILGGSWVGLSSSDGIRLNPFSMLDAEKMQDEEYLTDSLNLLSGVIASMVNLGQQREGRVEGVEEEHIAAACLAAWQEKGKAAEVSDVLFRLENTRESDDRLTDVVHKLRRFAKGGTYGNMFSGPANVSINNDFTVFEMSNIKAHKDLQQVILQIIMFLGSDLMFNTDRSTRVAILLDEAWDMLGGHSTAAFLEGVARRARKYRGCLITGTQSPSDYFKTPGARVCWENSDWNVMLAQKPDVIDALVSDGKLSLTPGTAYALKKLVSVAGQFSEVGIRGPEGWCFGRFVCDPTSLAVFSSRAETVQQIETLRKQHGMSMADAVEHVASSGAVL